MPKKPGILKRRINRFRRDYLAGRENWLAAEEDHTARVTKAHRDPHIKTFVEPIRMKGEEAAQMKALTKWNLKKLRRWQRIRRIVKGKKVLKKRRSKLKKRGAVKG